MERFGFMLRMLYSRKKCCMRQILEGLKRNVRGHAETCLLIIFSSRGCVVFSPIFLSNFLGGCPSHEKIKKHEHLDDIQRCGWVGMGWPCSEKNILIMIRNHVHWYYAFTIYISDAGANTFANMYLYCGYIVIVL